MTILFCKFVEALFLFLKCFVKGKNFTSFFFEVKKNFTRFVGRKDFTSFAVEKISQVFRRRERKVLQVF